MKPAHLSSDAGSGPRSVDSLWHTTHPTGTFIQSKWENTSIDLFICCLNTDKKHLRGKWSISVSS